MVVAAAPAPRPRRKSSFFRATTDIPRYDQHGLISRHISVKGLEEAWRSRVRWHERRGRPRHSRRVLEWNGVYVLYDLHLPPAVTLPYFVAHDPKNNFPATELGSLSTSVCLPGTTFESNGALVSPNGRYTFMQHAVGNELVVYDADGGAIWSLDLAPVGLEEEQPVVFTVFQQNGDLVQYAEGGRWKGRTVLWQAGVGALGGNRLVMQDDGNLVIYRYKLESAASVVGERVGYKQGNAANGEGEGEGGEPAVGDGDGERRLEIVWESRTDDSGSADYLLDGPLGP